MGYTLIANTAGNNATNAAFQAWGQAIANSIANCGIVKVSCTGEIDWTTVACPTTADQYMGFEIYRFDDALQSTAPVFFKIRYGSSAYGNTRPNVSLECANGAMTSGPLTGNLTGVTSTPRNWGTAGGHTNNNIQFYVSGDTNRYMLAWGAVGGTGSSDQTTFGVSIERTLDANGNVTGEGLLLLGKYYQTFEQVAWNCQIGRYTNWEGGLGLIMPLAGNGTIGSNTTVYPIFHNKGVMMNPGMNILAYHNPDLTANANVTINLYGADHTYKALGNSRWYGYAAQHRGPAGNTAFLIRWE